jgi:hypothetical protein
MKTYCKKAKLTDPKYIEPAVWGAFQKKWKRHDYGKVIAEYSGFTEEEIRRIAEDNDYWLFAPAIEKISCFIAECVRTKTLHVDEISQKAQKLISDYDKGRLIPCIQL